MYFSFLCPLYVLFELFYLKGYGLNLFDGIAFLLLLALVYMGVFITSSPSFKDGMIQFFHIPLVLFSSMVPLAPFGVGLAQLSMAGAYELFGLPASKVTGVRTASQMALLLVTLIVGRSIIMVNSSSKSGRIRNLE